MTKKILTLENLNIGNKKAKITIGTGPFTANILLNTQRHETIRCLDLDTTIFNSFYDEPYGYLWLRDNNSHGEDVAGKYLFSYGFGNNEPNLISSYLDKFILGYILPNQSPERESKGYKYKIRIIPNARLSTGQWLQLYLHDESYFGEFTTYKEVSLKATEIYKASDGSKFSITIYPYGKDGKYKDVIDVLHTNENFEGYDPDTFKNNVISLFNKIKFIPYNIDAHDGFDSFYDISIRDIKLNNKSIDRYSKITDLLK